MSRHTHRISLVLTSILLAAVPVGAQLPWEYSADQVITSSGQSVTHKVYVKKDRIRLETPQRGISILRFDRKMVWILMPDQKKYMELPLHGRDPLSGLNPDVKVERQAVGQEVVNGHPTKKNKTTTSFQGQQVVGYQWLATDLKELPIKWQNDTAKTTGELKNIKFGPQAASLFEIPQGYQKLSASAPGQQPPRAPQSKP